MKVCVAEGTLDLEVQGSSLAHRVVTLDKELYSTLSFFTQAYKIHGYRRHTAGGNPVMDVAILLGLLHATDTGISSSRVGLWLMCVFYKTVY